MVLGAVEERATSFLFGDLSDVATVADIEADRDDDLVADIEADRADMVADNEADRADRPDLAVVDQKALAESSSMASARSIVSAAID